MSMNVKAIYDTVTRTVSTTQGEFITYLDATVHTLTARYGFQYVIRHGKEYVKPPSVQTDIPVWDAYFMAIVDNVLYMLTGNSDRKTDFVQEADDAYRSVWTEQIRGKRILDRGYYHV